MEDAELKKIFNELAFRFNPIVPPEHGEDKEYFPFFFVFTFFFFYGFFLFLFYFSVQDMYWHFIDFIAKDSLLKYKNIKLEEFVYLFCHNVPKYQSFKSKVKPYYKKFKNHLPKIPVCGALVVNYDLDSVLLVRGLEKHPYGL
jgi:hypothetical protein